MQGKAFPLFADTCVLIQNGEVSQHILNFLKKHGQISLMWCFM